MINLEQQADIALQPSRKFKDALYSLYMVLGVFGISTAPIFFRFSEVGPFATGFWRTALASLLLFALATPQKLLNSIPKERSLSDYGWVILSGIFFSGNIASWHSSLVHTTVANATMLGNMTPLFLALWSWIFLREKLSGPILMGLTLAIGGALLLIGPNFTLTPAGFSGSGYGLLAACFLSGYILIVNHIRPKFNTLEFMAISTFSCSLSLCALTWFANESFHIGNFNSFEILLSLAIFAQVLGQGLIAYALPFLSVIFTSVALLIQPIIVAFLGWLFFAEALTSFQMMGIFIAITGLGLTKIATVTQTQEEA